MQTLFEEVKRRASIAEVVRSFGVKLDRAGKACCPFHLEDTPSFSVKKEDNIFKCFGCGESGDAVDFVAKIKGMDLLSAARLLAKMYGISVDGKPHGGGNRGAYKQVGKGQKRVCAANSAATRAIKDYITACNATVSRTDYLKRRGLNEDTIKKFFLGFDTEKQAVVIPYSSKLEYYQTRSVTDKKFRKPKTGDAGEEPLWGGDVLGNAKGVVFVVESPICALSIMQCGGVAVATGGTGGINKVINEIKAKKPKCIFILTLDNDEPGQKAQAELANRLFDLGVKFLPYNIADGYKDPNELLIANPSKLTANIKEAIQAAKHKFRRLKKMFSASDLQQKTIRPIRWIVRDLLPEGVTIVCAPSKYGKSWMMMQLCTAITQGKPFLNYDTVQAGCMYFSLEDSERRFQSRLNIVLKNKTAPDNFFGSTECSSMSGGLFEELAEVIENHPQIKLIVIDTFQRVRLGQSKNESAYAADYREIGEFKQFAERHGIAILLVHHLRKQIDESDIYNMINGSMGLMGAADTIWILAKKKREEASTAFVATGRDIGDTNLVLQLDKSNFHWEVIGSGEDRAGLEAKAEYEGNLAVRTIKILAEKHPQGWRGTCSDLKVKVFEETGQLYMKSPESIGKTLNFYADRLLGDGITVTKERNKRYLIRHKKSTLMFYGGQD